MTLHHHYEERLGPVVMALVLPSVAVGVVFGADPLAPTGEGDLIEGMPSFGWAFVKMMVVLAAILLGLLVISKWVLPRFLRTAPMRRSGAIIEVLDVRRLEPRKNVYLIRVADQCFLIGTSEAGFQTLSGGKLETAEVEAALNAARDRLESRSHRKRRSDGQSAEAEKRAFADMLKKPG